MQDDQVLACLEELEAAQINVGLYATQVNAREIHEIVAAGQAQPSLDEVKAALARAKQAGEVIEWHPDRFRSRIAETVRCLRLVRQRLWSQNQRTLSDAALLVEDVRVEFRQRQRPRRDAAPLSEIVPPALDPLLRRAFLRAMPFDRVSGFQQRALEQIFQCAQGGNRHDTSFIVAGDTGAGKTEAFLLPILLDIANEPEALRQRPGVRAVLVYPRIRLARNQLGRLLRYTRAFQQAGGPRLTVGIQNGDVPGSKADLAGMRKRKGWPSDGRGASQRYQVVLLEGCLTRGCEGQYWVHADDPAIDTGCPRLLCDRCGDVIDTLHITQAALKENAPDFLIITDVSLSQWLAREKYSHLWGLWQGDMQTVAPRFLVLDEVHLYEQIKGAHISRLIKRFQARTQLAYAYAAEAPEPGVRQMVHPLLIGVSATLHDAQRFLAKLLDVVPQDETRYQRLTVIQPHPEELENTRGRERYIFIYPRGLSPTPRKPRYRVNDQTAAIQIVMTVMHNLKPGREGVAWRGLAFFDSINDLRQFRHDYDKPVWGNGTPPANQDALWRIRTDRVRPAKGTLPAKQTLRGCGQCLQRAETATLGDCPTFNAGDCWIFAQTDGWNNQLRVADAVYAGATARELDDRDLIPTSPSLEVGYDDEAIQLVYQHKAPPSAASFIQRRGRAGRDPDDSPVIVTLLWPYRRDDAFYFFRPEALYDPTFDDVPLNAGNFNVQRTHALLAFFDLLACLRRQDMGGLRQDPRILDFTVAGSAFFTPETIQSFTWLEDPKRQGEERLWVKHRETKEESWISGKALDSVKAERGQLAVKGWLAMAKGLTTRVLQAAFEAVQRVCPVEDYLRHNRIVTPAFRTHRAYPFRTLRDSNFPDQLLRQFGARAWHSDNDQEDRGNWIQTFRHIDWMLQGNEEATTLIIHYPNPDPQQAEEDEAWELTASVTFALTELLPGNVTYRVREEGAIHWTPIPRDGDSTFLYPEEAVEDEAGEKKRQPIAAFQPHLAQDLAKQPDSIFGIPRYLHQAFPTLPFMTVQRLRVAEFGRPDRQESSQWFYDVQQKKAVEQNGGDAIPISRRSFTLASSVIIPHVASNRQVAQSQLLPPLATLFATIDGFLEAGRAMLGYTRVFYEMEIHLKTSLTKQEQQARNIQEGDLTLRRSFYDPHGKPTLVGYAIETHGIRFELAPDILRRTIARIMKDDGLRLRLRRTFTVYRMAPFAFEKKIFVKNMLDVTEVAVDYWLHKVVVASEGRPRLLDAAIDLEPLLEYYKNYRIVRAEEVEQHREWVTDEFLTRLNAELEGTYQSGTPFEEFVESVLLHSLTALLKNLIARLGGVGNSDLVAYADLPLLDQVDRTQVPRILIMDSVEGGSGGIAQAFERLDLSSGEQDNHEGSLWWTLQTELGSCPIAHGEALVRAVLTHPQTTDERLKEVRQARTKQALESLLTELDLTAPMPEAMAVLGRVLFNVIEINGYPIVVPLILKELFALQEEFALKVPGSIPRTALIQRILGLLEEQPNRFTHRVPAILALRTALDSAGVAERNEEASRLEWAWQLDALYKTTCEDGCPVCLSARSEMEHYYLSPLLNSRRVLRKLREELAAALPPATGSVLEHIKALEDGPLRLKAHPGSLVNNLNQELGLGVVAHVDERGQIEETSTVATHPERLRSLAYEAEAWEKRWEAGRTLQVPNGPKVRSRAEYIIANELQNANIAYLYEPSLPFREAGTLKFIHPDFHLFEHDIYLEYWGRDDPEYLESRSYKERIYETLRARRHFTLIHIEKDEVDTMHFMTKVRAALVSQDG